MESYFWDFWSESYGIKSWTKCFWETQDTGFRCELQISTDSDMCFKKVTWALELGKSGYYCQHCPNYLPFHISFLAYNIEKMIHTTSNVVTIKYNKFHNLPKTCYFHEWKFRSLFIKFKHSLNICIHLGIQVWIRHRTVSKFRLLQQSNKRFRYINI